MSFVLDEIRQLVLGSRELIFLKISRSQNKVADLLASSARRGEGVEGRMSC